MVIPEGFQPIACHKNTTQIFGGDTKTQRQTDPYRLAFVSHRMDFYHVAFYRIVFYCMVFYRIYCHRMGFYRISCYRMAFYRMKWSMNSRPLRSTVARSDHTRANMNMGSMLFFRFSAASGDFLTTPSKGRNSSK